MYFYEKVKVFHDLNLGQMTIEDCFTKFVDFMRFIPYLRESEAKVKYFMSCFPQAYKD